MLNDNKIKKNLTCYLFNTTKCYDITLLFYSQYPFGIMMPPMSQSLFTQSVLQRLLISSSLILLLWGLIFWAVALP